MTTNETKKSIDLFIKILLISLLLLWSLAIVRPFVTLIVWSIILAVALYPLYQKLLRLTKGSKKSLVTSLFVLVLLALVLLPSLKLTISMADSGKVYYKRFNEGTLKIPPPADNVKEWPLIGESLYNAWSIASKNLQEFIVEHKDQIKKSLDWLFDSVSGLVGSVLLGLFSLILAGVFMSNADSGYRSGVKLGNRLVSGKGEEFMLMSMSTIRSVVKGILLVAVIQAALAYLGFVVIKLPAAGLFALLVLIFAIVQIPAVLAMIPAIAIVFTYSETTPAIIFTIYAIIVSLADNVLKPMLLGKGLETPMLVILMGALGGMMLDGIMGLFIGPVVLSLVYKMYNSWVEEGNED